MGLFGGFFGRLLGSPKALNETVRGVRDGVDALFYTNQEKAVDLAQERTEFREMLIKWMESTQGQNLSRRIIALSITFVWLVMFVSRMALAIVGVWAEKAVKWQESADIIGDSIGQMTGAVMLILGFYFASPYLGDISKKAMDKFSSSNKKKEIKDETKQE